MRSYQWRLQATRATAPVVRGAATHHSAMPAPPSPARPGLRAAQLASVCVGALAILLSDTADAVDGTWIGPGAEWTVGTNWSSGTVPDGTATFTNNNPTSVTISGTTSNDTIDFSAASTTYSYTVTNGCRCPLIPGQFLTG